METNSEVNWSRTYSTHVSTSAVPTAFRVQEDHVVVALEDGKIQLFNIDGTNKKLAPTSQGAVWALAIRGSILASGGTDADIEIWHIATGLVKLDRHTSTIRALIFLNDNWLISASRDTTIRVWDITEGNCIQVLNAHSGTVRNLAMSNLGNYIVSGSHDGTACVWRVTHDNRLECLHTLRGHEGTIYCAGFVNTTGTLIVTGGADKCVRVWNLEDGQCQTILRGHDSLVNRLIISGSRLFTADAGGWIYVWAIGDTSEMIHRLQAHHVSVVSLAYHEMKIVSGGTEGSLTLYDVQNKELLGQLTSASCVWAVAFLEDGRIVMVVRHDGAIMLEIWEAN